MTNNPTIDGVSRELLTDLVKLASRNIRSAWGGGVCQEARALLDADHTENPLAMVAPAVERQEPAESVAAIVTEWVEGGIRMSTDWRNGLSAIIQRRLARFPTPEVVALQSTIAQLRIDLGNQTELTRQADYHASQRGKEIAQLQARIADLESARGEPVAWMYHERAEDGHEYRPLFSQAKWSVFPEGFYKESPLYTGPPAPVAVVLPERKIVDNKTSTRDYVMGCGWNACLDATAALNGVKK